MPSSWLATIFYLLVVFALIAVVGLIVYAVKVMRRRSNSPSHIRLSNTPDRQHSRDNSSNWVIYNVELAEPTDPEPPETSEFLLSCPHCGFSGPMDDLSLVGESVDCPFCEEPFLVLEPESV